jgi:hypothetical protein
MIVVMNKQDASTPAAASAAEAEYRKILDEELRDARGRISREIPIMPSIAVNTSYGTELIDAVIRQLAQSLKRA